ncbi:hypothetical protein [Nocardia niwae]|uniref:hypothetical protein n=1 Tax=Nocardia niwae TaxID=626084 RepID=UPI0007A53DA0|nr:hypothetical protein [Nocardia niwae]
MPRYNGQTRTTSGKRRHAVTNGATITVAQLQQRGDEEAARRAEQFAAADTLPLRRVDLFGPEVDGGRPLHELDYALRMAEVG